MLQEFNVKRFVVHDESPAERGLTKDDLVLDVEMANCKPDLLIKLKSMAKYCHSSGRNQNVIYHQ